MHMHAHGYVHRDVSPNNVMRLLGGRWVLADYGLVGRPRGSSLTRPGMRFGTDFFSAPEVFFEPTQATAKADAYSIGALAEWFTNITAGQNPTSPVGRAWHALISNTRLFDPEDRWTIAEIVDHLNAMPLPVAVLVGSNLDACPACGGRVGRDHAERCRRCGYHDPY
jgi:serine/threonine protein kinase